MFKEFQLISKFIECFMIIKNNIPFEYSDYVLKSRFLKIAENQNWLSLKKIMLAVSGGGDSTALAWFFHKYYDGEFIIVHVNHLLRGEDAFKDENFVSDLAREMNVEFIPVVIDVNNNKLKGESTETAARRIRHSEFVRIANENNIDGVALGHNRDDLAETVLFNILRGSGIRGAVGIPETNVIEGVKFFRPLLSFRRDFLRKFLEYRGLKWCEDYTNQEGIYTRNFIRLELLPLISEKINSNAIEHLAEFAEDMRPVRSDEELKSVNLLENAKITDLKFDAKKIRKFSDKERNLIIRELGRELKLTTLSRNRCDELSRLLSKTEPFIFQWCGGCNIESKGGFINVKIS